MKINGQPEHCANTNLQCYWFCFFNFFPHVYEYFYPVQFYITGYRFTVKKHGAKISRFQTEEI